jgi:hypothetical protein
MGLMAAVTAHLALRTVLDRMLEPDPTTLSEALEGFLDATLPESEELVRAMEAQGPDEYALRVEWQVKSGQEAAMNLLRVLTRIPPALISSLDRDLTGAESPPRHEDNQSGEGRVDPVDHWLDRLLEFGRNLRALILPATEDASGSGS